METSIKLPDEQGHPWHTLGVNEVLHAQGVEAASGLNLEEVRRRLQHYGPNQFAAAKKEPAWHAFLRQYQDPMQIVLVIAGLLSAVAIRQWGTALVLWALTLFNALMGLRQEGKAEASVAALQQMLTVKVRVRRDRGLLEIASEDVVPGDIVVLEAGDRVPADGRIIKAASLEIDESALTGESVPVPKQIEVVAGADAPLGDRADMAYMNTHVTHGAGELVVTATGMATEVGHISGLLETTETEETPLTKQLNTLTKQIILIACLALAVSILLGYSRGQTLDTLFLTSIAFAVAAIPTGLPAVVTFLLARGTTQLAAEGAIVKRLRSVETLGATSAINTDKTGTLTLNQMTAISMTIAGRQVTATGEGYSSNGQITQTGGKPPIDLAPFLLPMVLASDAVVKDGELVGDPTEGALVVFATKSGLDVEATHQAFPRLAEVPFDAAYKLMATFHRMQNEQGQEVIRCFVKGAPDQLLARSSQGLDANGQIVPIDAYRERVLAANERYAREGLRVMALARKDIDPAIFQPDGDLLAYVHDLTMLALVGIVDPPRPEVKPAIAEAKAAGIAVRMITGDHAVTAAAIARQLVIEGRAITGADFSAMSDEEALRQVGEIGVIARVTPEDKVRLVEVLKQQDQIVAMTGDGVNDAPALKRADIGIAMGITGTDVAKEAAVMILTDDNFATIIRAVRLGRGIYDNLLKYIHYQMGSLFAFILTFLGAAIFNILHGIPFLPLQTLWLNFTVDLFEAIGLGTGKPASNLMEQSPRPAHAQILPLRLAARYTFFGLLMAASTLLILALTAGSGDVVARTMGLTTFSFARIFFALETNDTLQSVFHRDVLENHLLLKMSALALLTTFLITELGFMNRLFTTTPLDVGQWLLCVAFGSLVLWVMEGMKFFSRRARSPSAGRPTAPTRAPTPAIGAI